MAPPIQRKMVKRQVLVHGLVYFGRVFAEMMNGDGWEFSYFPDSGIGNLAAMARKLKSCDLVYQVGGRITRGKFLHAARSLGKQHIVMHWVGSDTLDAEKSVCEQGVDNWVVQRIHHWAESEWLQKEVEALGARCELMPFPSALVPDRPRPMPAEFRVLVYVPTVTRSELYGLDRVLQVARELPHISFELVGLLDGPIPDPPENLLIHGRAQNLNDFYRRASVVWRPVRHDGISWMVMESLGHGRHVLWSYPFPGCIQVKDEIEAREQITRLHSLHENGLLKLNEEGAQFIARGGYHPQVSRKKIHARLENILES
jgi:hypothetical protein